MSIDLHPIHELRIQIVAIERSAANSSVSPDCQSYLDLSVESRRVIEFLLQRLEKVEGRLSAWERGGYGAVSPPEVMEVDRCS